MRFARTRRREAPVGRVQILGGPSRARERPLGLVAPAIGVVVAADREPDRRLARDPGVDSAQEVLEEAVLHETALERVERPHVVADVDLQKLVARTGREIALDVPAQVETRSSPVPRRENWDLDGPDVREV